MKTHRGYRYRIYPTATQSVLIAQILGCCRFVYNHCLSLRKETYAREKRNVSQSECMRIVTALRHSPETVWLAACDSMALQEAVKDLEKAYNNFIEKRAGYPKYRRRRSGDQTYRTRNQSGVIRIGGNRINLPKLGPVKAKISRLPKGRILNATVTRAASGGYYVSLCVEEELTPKPNAGGEVGIDLGIKDFYTDSNGVKAPNNKYLRKYEKQLKREQRKLSRMIEANIAGYTKDRRPVWKKPLSECRNIQKQRIKTARIHEKIYNCRTDTMHKTALKLVNENQIIAAESLNIRGMVRNRRLAKAISDASWGRFLTILEYKAFEHGCRVIRIPAFYPSSQVCSDCGNKNPRVKDLSVRRWTCSKCGCIHDRDENAAVNILKAALKLPEAI